MGDEFLQAVNPSIVLQIEAMQGCRRVWVASLCASGDPFLTIESPTQALPQFRGLRVSGLMCAETPAGRERILAHLGHPGHVLWREESIGGAQAIARRLAARTGGVVHLVLFDEPNRVVWEAVPRG